MMQENCLIYGHIYALHTYPSFELSGVCYISTATIPMATKLGSVLGSHDPLIMCSCEIARQINPIKSPQAQWLSEPKLVGW